MAWYDGGSSFDKKKKRNVMAGSGGKLVDTRGARKFIDVITSPKEVSPQGKRAWGQTGRILRTPLDIARVGGAKAADWIANTGSSLLGLERKNKTAYFDSRKEALYKDFDAITDVGSDTGRIIKNDLLNARQGIANMSDNLEVAKTDSPAQEKRDAALSPVKEISPRMTKTPVISPRMEKMAVDQQPGGYQENGTFIDKMDPNNREAVLQSIMAFGLNMMKAGGKTYDKPVSATSIVGDSGLKAMGTYQNIRSRNKIEAYQDERLAIAKDANKRQGAVASLEIAAKKLSLESARPLAELTSSYFKAKDDTERAAIAKKLNQLRGKGGDKSSIDFMDVDGKLFVTDSSTGEATEVTPRKRPAISMEAAMKRLRASSKYSKYTDDDLKAILQNAYQFPK